jgi:NADH-quinone oxidoreductase subunit K
MAGSISIRRYAAEGMNHSLSLLAFLFKVRAGAASTALESIKHPDLSKFLVIGAILFIIGVAGVLTRRNIIVIFMSIELILNAGEPELHRVLALLAGHRRADAIRFAGPGVHCLHSSWSAAAEAAIGLGIVIALYRNRETIWVDEIDLMKW